jgi:hypothetical protein
MKLSMGLKKEVKMKTNITFVMLNLIGLLLSGISSAAIPHVPGQGDPVEVKDCKPVEFKSPNLAFHDGTWIPVVQLPVVTIEAEAMPVKRARWNDGHPVIVADLPLVEITAQRSGSESLQVAEGTGIQLVVYLPVVEISAEFPVESLSRIIEYNEEGWLVEAGKTLPEVNIIYSAEPLPMALIPQPVEPSDANYLVLLERDYESLRKWIRLTVWSYSRLNQSLSQHIRANITRQPVFIH